MAKQRDQASSATGETHRWAVDQLEEGTAAVEQDGDHMYEIPRWLVPATAREGDVLSASVTARAQDEVSITVRITPAEKRPPGRKAARSPTDRGGDIVL